MIHQSFIPGSTKNIKKLSKTDLQSRIECLCFHDTHKKLKTAQNDPNYQSNNMRIANIIVNSNGISKTLNNGNSYLNLESQLLIDSLGSIEGQPGGSFRPLRNKF
jgi:hypothetical protein